MSGMTVPEKKSGLHPRNKHQGRYDFTALSQTLPALAPFVAKNEFGDDSIDFADPAAVKTLNRALLKHFYGIANWGLPADYLCPPIPGRADYIHHLSELLSTCNRGKIPEGDGVRILDVGVGANCVYPIVGRTAYGWSFVGSDIDPVALASAENIVRSNPSLAGGVVLRRQTLAANIFRGVVREGEVFDASICNPPFHASREEALAAAQRKLAGLTGGAPPVDPASPAPVLNFSGKATELWCQGGETGFARRMIIESAKIPYQVFWFTTLISKESNLPDVYHELRRANVKEKRTIVMAQGHKVSRIVAWTFFNKSQQEKWRAQLTP
jgi:23S rRNA (adenine1618-N6)-methyltransferase